ncbi:MAG: recombinase RecT [Bacteroidia bacterium]
MSDRQVTAAPPRPTAALMKPLNQCVSIGEALQSSELLDRIKQSTPRHMSPERLLRVFSLAVTNTPALAKANMRSLLGAMLSCSQLGLEPNTPQGHAYLIPFDKKAFNRETRKWEVERTDVQLILGYKGLLDLAFRSGLVTSIHCDIVLPGDEWSYEYGSNGHLRHKPAGTAAPGTDPTYAYMHSKLKGGEAYEVMPWSKVLAIRNGSQGYRAALAAKGRAEEQGRQPPAAWTEAPWVKYQDAMGRKTALRAGAKWLPSSIEMAAALAMDEAQDRRALDFGMAFDGTATVLEGFDEQPQDDPDSDTGGAFGVRQVEQEPPTKQPDPPKVVTTPKPQSTAAQRAESRPAVTTPKAEETRHASRGPHAEVGYTSTFPPGLIDDINSAHAFSHNLITEHGEVLPGVTHTDPVTWMRAYAVLWSSSENRDALYDHNADAYEEAILSDAAAALAPGDDMPQPATAIAMPVVQGKPSFTGYIAALRAALPALTATTIDAWASAQDVTIATLPAASKRSAEKAIADRRTALGTDRAGLPQSAVQVNAAPAVRADAVAVALAQRGDEANAAPAPPDDGDEPPDSPPFDGEVTAPAAPARKSPQEETADSLMAQIDTCDSVAELNALNGNVAVARQLERLKAEAPALWKQVFDYANARRDVLNARPA